MKRKTFNTPFFGASKINKTAAIMLVTASLGASLAHAQTTLSLGDVYVTGFNANAPDGFAFVLLRDVAAGTDIRFTDNGFLAAASANATNNARGGENFLRWVAPTGGLTAGTVVRWVNGTGASVGTVPFGVLDGISNSGDQIFVYQGSGAGTSNTTMNFTANSSPTTFNGTILNGMNSGSWLTTGTASSNTSYLPTQLNTLNGNAALGGSTRGNYSGARTGLTATAYGYALSNAANWTTATGAGVVTLTSTDFTISPSVALHWDANGTAVNNGGAGTWDTSTQSRFKNGASGTTFMPWVNSTAGNNHTAVFGGTAGTVTVSGGVTASGLQFDTTGYTLTDSTITLLGDSTPTINTLSDVNANINSALAGSAGFNKTGNGVLTLGSVSNSYTGATNINAGSLIVNGSTSSSSAFTVASGATLGGSGTVAGTVNVSGNIAPAGILKTGTTTWNGGSNLFQFNLTENPLTSDKLEITGAFNKGTGSTFKFDFMGSEPTHSGVYTLATWTEAPLNAFSPSNFSFENLTGTYNSGTFSITSNQLRFTAVPEASNLLIGGLFGLGLMTRRRKQA